MAKTKSSIWDKNDNYLQKKLIELAAPKTRSAAEIAAELYTPEVPITRNMVIGKLRRIDLRRGKLYDDTFVSKRKQKRENAAKNREERAAAKLKKDQEKALKKRGRPRYVEIPVKSAATTPIVHRKPNRNTLFVGRREEPKTKKEMMEELQRAVLNTGGVVK